MTRGSYSDAEPSPTGMSRRERLSRRDDLAYAVGIAFSVPLHGRDNHGKWRYGAMSIGGEVDPNHVEAFDKDVTAILSSSLERHIAGPAGGVEREARVAEGHDYSTGPTAQEWPQIFYELYRDARPVLADGASLL